jgi:hypothetical protein
MLQPSTGRTCEGLSVERIIGRGEQVTNDVLPVADLSTSGQNHRILHDLAHDGILKRKKENGE